MYLEVRKIFLYVLACICRDINYSGLSIIAMHLLHILHSFIYIYMLYYIALFYYGSLILYVYCKLLEAKMKENKEFQCMLLY